MTPDQEAWIAAYVERQAGFVRGKCAEATLEMLAAFPALRRVAGLVRHAVWPVQPHWWLVAPDGSIVDPTVAQFAGWPIDYEELDLADTAARAKIPRGRCAYCGETLFTDRNFCNSDCEFACCSALNAQRRMP